MALFPGLVVLQQATGSAAGGPGFFDLMVLVGPLLLIFYFFILRPQEKRRRAQTAMLKSIERGDTLVTSGGLHGKVSGVTDDVLTVEIASLKGGERVRIKLQRSRVDEVIKAKGGDEK